MQWFRTYVTGSCFKISVGSPVVTSTACDFQGWHAKGTSGRILIFPASRTVPSYLICLNKGTSLPFVR